MLKPLLLAAGFSVSFFLSWTGLTRMVLAEPVAAWPDEVGRTLDPAAALG